MMGATSPSSLCLNPFLFWMRICILAIRGIIPRLMKPWLSRYFSLQDGKLLAATRGNRLKDTTLQSLKTKREEAGSLLAGAEVR